MCRSIFSAIRTLRCVSGLAQRPRRVIRRKHGRFLQYLPAFLCVFSLAMEDIVNRHMLAIVLLIAVMAILASCFNPVTSPSLDEEEPPESPEPTGPTLGLIGQWNFANSFDDSSGAGETILASAGTPVFVNDRDGNPNSALDFDASTDQATVPNYAALNNTPVGITVSFWVTPPSADGRIISRRYGDSDSVWEIDVFGSQLRASWSGYSKLWAEASTLDQPWNHVVLTIDTGDGDLASLYVNGVLESVLQASNDVDANRDIQDVSSENDILIGNTDTFGTLFTGALFQFDDLRIYSRAVSESEVLELYNLPAASGM